MILRQFGYRLALAVAVLVGGCAPSPREVAHPPMWEVRDADSRMVLIGSVHRLPASLDWSGGAVASEVATADELWLELSPDALAGAPALFARIQNDEAVPPLSARLPQDAAASIRRLVVAGGLAANDVDATESWALAIAAGRGALAQTDFTSGNGVEQRLIDAMRQRRRAIVGLETAADQLDAFDALPPPVQDRMLAAVARRAPEAPAQARILVAAWARGDEPALARIAAEGLADTPELIEPLVLARNRRWARRLARRMQQPGNVLVAVGTGHLVGDESLPVLLRRAGLRVQRLRP